MARPGGNPDLEAPPKGNQRARTHGIHSFEARGPEALAPLQRARRVEIMEALAEPGGADQVLREQAADARLIVEMGLSHLREKYEGDKAPGKLKYKVWEDPIIKRLATYMAEARRTLTALGEVVDGPKDVTALIAEEDGDDS